MKTDSQQVTHQKSCCHQSGLGTGMDSAEECKILGNESVAAKNWESAYKYYLKGIALLRPSDATLRVILTSNISLVLLQLSRHQEALDEAAKCMELDPKFEKGYLRYAAALEALNLKVADSSLADSCPVMKTYRKGLEINPGSTLIADAMKISFPLVNANAIARSAKTSSKTKSSKMSKKQLSGIARAEREACVSLDIRGATGQHELRVNGRYDPTDELSGGWPIYRKHIELIPGENDEVDEDDNFILEFHSGLDEWMVKHVSSKGSHRSFVFIKCSPPTRPELCKNSCWQSMEDKKLMNQSSMSVLTIDQRHEEDVAFFKRERDSCTIIEVRGATGRRSLGINGVFEPTEDCCGGWPVYRKIADVESDNSAGKTNGETFKDDQSAASMSSTAISSPSSSSSSPQNTSVWMEYNPYFRSWQVKPTPCLGSNRSWGYSNANTMHGTLPQLSRGVWEVLEDEDFRPQESICLMTLTQWQIEDEKLAQLWSNSCSIDIRGATGTYGPIVNGVYDPMSTFVGGYQKHTDPKCIIEYSRMRKLWQLKFSQEACAFVPDDSRSLLQLCPAVWYVMVNGNWERQPTVKVSSLSSRRALDNEMYGDKLPDAMPLDVRGATGVNAFKINGVYEPIDEFSGGWPVYQRKGGVDYWLEYNEERGNWQIKSASHRGMDSAFAYVDSFPSKYPQKCGGVWWVYTGVRGANSNSGWEIQQSVTILSVADRTAEDMKSYEKRRTHCVPLDIRGATGPRGGGLNGVFDPTDEMRGGWPVYLKRDDGEWWLEYDACPQKWMIRPTACRGTTRGRAYILCDPHTRPERAKGVWRLSDGKGGWAPEPTVQVVSEAEAIAQDKILFDARRAVAVEIAIRGAVKPVGHINGIYEPTDESWHAWPVYKKKGCDTHYLEFHAPSSSWQVKPATVRGTKRCWAYVHSENEHPELSSKLWLVIVNGEHAKQDSIAITTLQEQSQNDKVLGNIRRRSCHPIKIRGATGKHAAVINGTYEPSPTELCGGWPVYYNNSTLKGEAVKPLKTAKSGESETDVTKSFLLFCPYAMSWAITVLASVNDSRNDNDSSNPGSVSPVPNLNGKVTGNIIGNSSEYNATENGVDKNPEKPDAAAGSVGVEVEVSTPTRISADQDKDSKLAVIKSTVSTLPFYTPSSAPLTLAFFEVSTNTQPELAHGAATWKVLCGSQFEPQLSIKVCVAVDPVASKPVVTPPKVPPANTKQKLSTAPVAKNKESNNGRNFNGSSSSGNGNAGNSNTSTSNLSQMNLNQIGVKNQTGDQRRQNSDATESSLFLTNKESLNELLKEQMTSVSKDVKKNATNSWQTKGIISNSEIGPGSGLNSSSSSSSMAANRNNSSPGGKLTTMRSVPDNMSDDGVGVSNAEVEDEWLEVKQKRPKGSNNTPANLNSKGGPQSTVSPQSIAVKEGRSRSSSPTSSAGQGGVMGGGSGHETYVTSQIQLGVDGKRNQKEESVDGPLHPQVPAVTSSVVSTMGFKAAVMSGQQESSSFNPTHTHTPTPTQSHTQVVPQSFSARDFPAMPSSSATQRAPHSYTAPHSSSPTPIPVAVQLVTPSTPTAVSAVPAHRIDSTSPSLPVASITPPHTDTSAATTTDTNAITISTSSTSKKALKTKKKAVKVDTDISHDVPKERSPDVRKECSAEAFVLPTVDISNPIGAAHSTAPLRAVITGTVTGTADLDRTFTSTSTAAVESQIPLELHVPQGINSEHALQNCVYKPSIQYNMPPLTAVGSYASHVTQSAQEAHIHDMHGMRPPSLPLSLPLSMHPPQLHTHSNRNLSRQGHLGLQEDQSVGVGVGDGFDYMYQHPMVDEENDDDLFMAISSANAIDFDPSFTANNLARSASSTLSPLSRRIGSRNDLGIIHESLPRQVNGSGGMLPPYGSSMLDPPGRPPPTLPLTNAEGFLSGISFDFFSSLLHPSVQDNGSCGMMRKEGSIMDLPHHTSDSLPIPMQPNYPLSMNMMDSHSSSLEDMQLNELSPLCSEYQYRGTLLNEEIYTESDTRNIRYQMPTLIPIPPTELKPPNCFNTIDQHTSSSMNINMNGYGKSGILDLPLGSPPPPPVLLTARELSLATDNFSTSHLLNATDTAILKTLDVGHSRSRTLAGEDILREKERDICICTFVGTIRRYSTLIKIVTPYLNGEVDTVLQSQYLRELQVLSEFSHPNILSLYGYTFRPYARVFRIPPGTPSLEAFYSVDCQNHSPTGMFFLHTVLSSPERRIRFTWKMRLRVVTCILRALSYLHLGDKEAGRCPVAHNNVHVGTIALSSLEGDALLTDFSFSTDIFTHNIDSDNGDYRTETEEDIFSAGTVMLQLLTGQHDTNHSDILKARGLFNSEESVKQKLNSSSNCGNRKVRRKNNSKSSLNSTQLEVLIGFAESEVWPVLVIHRIAEALTTFFSTPFIDPSGDPGSGKCEQLLAMLHRITIL